MTPLRVESTHVQGCFVVKLVGEIDLSNLADAREELDELMGTTDSDLVLDLEEVRYLDSAAIHLIFRIAQHLSDEGQHMALAVPVSSPLRRMLKFANVSDVIPILGSVTEAVQKLSSTPQGPRP